MRYPCHAQPPKMPLRCVCRQGRDGGYSRAVGCQNRLPCGFRTVRLWHDAPRPEKPRKCSTAKTRRRPYAPAPRLFCVPVLAAFDLAAAFRQDQPSDQRTPCLSPYSKMHVIRSAICALFSFEDRNPSGNGPELSSPSANCT